MDPFTHGLLGATYASLFNKKRSSMRLAAFCGCVGALSPDLDIVIRAANNPMFGLGMHRFFTHSVFLAPLLSLLVAGFFWLFLRKKMVYGQIYLFVCLGMMTHGMLDSMTNYGTHLFWPLTNSRENWSIISIVDPIFTGILLVCLIIALIRKSKIPFIFSMAFALCYWGMGLYQREAATDVMVKIATQRGQTPVQFEVKPSLANIIVWRTQYQYDGLAYIDAFHISPWAGEKYYGGGIVTLYKKPIEASSIQAEDVSYFHFFSDGWIAANPENPLEIGDIRFALLPNQTKYLWAIRLKPEAPDEHVEFVSTRQQKAGDIAELWHMIQGLEIKETP